MYQKPIVTCLLAVLCLASSVNAKPGKRPASRREGWELVWHDEFGGRKLSDEWTRIPRFPNPSEWNKYMSSDDRLYEVRGGKLILYGRTNDFLPEGQWPHGGEIDIMERLNSDDYAHQTIHSAVTEYDTVARKSQDWHYTAPIRQGKWNVYSVELYEDSVCFLVNDRLTFTYRREPDLGPRQFPYDRPMYLLLDMQLGGHWVGRVDPRQLPYRYQIDYVRFYRKKN